MSPTPAQKPYKRVLNHLQKIEAESEIGSTPFPGPQLVVRKRTRYEHDTMRKYLLLSGMDPRDLPNMRLKGGRQRMNELIALREYRRAVRTGGPLPRKRGPKSQAERESIVQAHVQLREICDKLGYAYPDQHWRHTERTDVLKTTIQARRTIYVDTPQSTECKAYVAAHLQLIGDKSAGQGKGDATFNRRKAIIAMRSARARHALSEPKGLEQFVAWLLDAIGMQDSAINAPRRGILKLVLLNVVANSRTHAALWESRNEHEDTVNKARVSKRKFAAATTKTIMASAVAATKAAP
jgi:hypothetical protein